LLCQPDGPAQRLCRVVLRADPADRTQLARRARHASAPLAPKPTPHLRREGRSAAAPPTPTPLGTSPTRHVRRFWEPEDSRLARRSSDPCSRNPRAATEARSPAPVPARTGPVVTPRALLPKAVAWSPPPDQGNSPRSVASGTPGARPPAACSANCQTAAAPGSRALCIDPPHQTPRHLLGLSRNRPKHSALERLSHSSTAHNNGPAFHVQPTSSSRRGSNPTKRSALAARQTTTQLSHHTVRTEEQEQPRCTWNLPATDDDQEAELDPAGAAPRQDLMRWPGLAALTDSQANATKTRPAPSVTPRGPARSDVLAGPHHHPNAVRSPPDWKREPTSSFSRDPRLGPRHRSGPAPHSEPPPHKRLHARAGSQPNACPGRRPHSACFRSTRQRRSVPFPYAQSGEPHNTFNNQQPRTSRATTRTDVHLCTSSAEQAATTANKTSPGGRPVALRDPTPSAPTVTPDRGDGDQECHPPAHPAVRSEFSPSPLTAGDPQDPRPPAGGDVVAEDPRPAGACAPR
jgi:hypothetical protein